MSNYIVGFKRVRISVSNVEPLPLCLLGSATEYIMWNSVSLSTSPHGESPVSRAGSICFIKEKLIRAILDRY